MYALTIKHVHMHLGKNNTTKFKTRKGLTRHYGLDGHQEWPKLAKSLAYGEPGRINERCILCNEKGCWSSWGPTRKARAEIGQDLLLTNTIGFREAVLVDSITMEFPLIPPPCVWCYRLINDNEIIRETVTGEWMSRRSDQMEGGRSRTHRRPEFKGALC